MADVVLFHHILGLTPGVNEFADDLRQAGHTVHTPDLFESRRFGSYFADRTRPSYDPDAAALLLSRTLGFLRAVA